MNGRSSSAHVLFDQIKAGGVGFLQGMVNSSPPTFEEEWLDFKGASPLPPDPKIKEIWSKALAGFANTEGGVLIWGIDARKDPTTGVDCASALSLVPDPNALKTRLMQLHHQSTDPPVLNVDIESYPDPSSTSGAGFVVCLIPESPFKPHRTEHLTNKPYYIRAGDDFVIPSPALLRHLFFPHTYSHLWVEVGVSWKAAGNRADVSYEARIHNSGTATAQDVFVVLQTEDRPTVAGEDWIKQGNPQGHIAFEGRRSLHPGTVSRLFVMTHSVQVDVPSPFEEARFRFLMYARDREPQIAVVEFSEAEIEGKAMKQGVAESGDWHRHIPGGGTARGSEKGISPIIDTLGQLY